MKKKILIIIEVLILIGLVSGFSYWLGRESIEVKTGVAPGIFKSKMIKYWSAITIGEVKEISDHNLILSSDGETLTIFILGETRIEARISETQEPKEVDFEDIKIGDKVKIQLVIDSEGNIVGNLITVLP